MSLSDLMMQPDHPDYEKNMESLAEFQAKKAGTLRIHIFFTFFANLGF